MAPLHGVPAWRARKARASARAASRDGVSAAAFGMPDTLSFYGALAIRGFDCGNRDDHRRHSCVLSEKSPTPGG